jgi:hypothetical protein
MPYVSANCAGRNQKVSMSKCSTCSEGMSRPLTPDSCVLLVAYSAGQSITTAVAHDDGSYLYVEDRCSVA